MVLAAGVARSSRVSTVKWARRRCAFVCFGWREKNEKRAIDFTPSSVEWGRHGRGAMCRALTGAKAQGLGIGIGIGGRRGQRKGKEETGRKRAGLGRIDKNCLNYQAHAKLLHQPDALARASLADASGW